MRGHISQKQKKALQRRKVFVVISLVGVIAFAVGLGWLIRQPFLRIADISVRGNNVVDSNRLIESVRAMTQGMNMFVIPNDSILFYPEHTIIDAILGANPTLKSAELSISTDRTLTLSVSERTPMFYWCTSTEECYEVDTSGYVYRPRIIDTGLVTLYGWLDMTADIVGETYAPPFIYAIEQSIDFFKSEQITITDVRFADNADFDFVTDKDVIFKLDFTDSVDTTFNQLDIFINQNESFIETGDFEYVDARFGRKIFYTRKNDTTE